MKQLLKSTFLAAFVFLLVGCKLNAVTTVKPDGSGEWRTESGFSAEERQNLENQSNAPSTQDFCNSRTTLEGVTITQEMRGDETWCISTSTFRSLDDLRATLEERNGLTVNKLEFDGDRFVYDIDIDTISKDSEYSSLTDLNWTLNLPGDPIGHNADVANGRSLVWTPETRSGIVHIHAESAVDKSPLSILPILLILSAVLVGAGLWMLVRRRRPTASTSDPTTVRVRR